MDSSLTETRLLAAKQGDQNAFEKFVGEIHPLAMCTIKPMIVDYRDAEEIFSDTMVAIWRSLQKFVANKGDALAWVLAITRNTAHNFLRHKRALKRDGGTAKLVQVDQLNSPSRDNSQEATTENPHSILAAKEIWESFFKAANRLSQRKREVAISFFWYGQNCEEIGALFDTSKKTVALQLHQARVELRKKLAPEFFGLAA